MDFAQTLVAGMAAPSPVSAYTGTSVGSPDASGGGSLAPASATQGRPGLVLLAALVLALYAFGYWTR